jgi:tRNA 5-methylaminomethyl-2-thiouridine biosynthesis bifunctional protein
MGRILSTQLMKLKNPNLSWQESGHPYSVDFDDIYFSASDPVGESTHVFIEGNKLRQRFKSFEEKVFTVGEIGFGSGLNFLLTRKVWLELSHRGSRLHYLAFENHPLSHKQLLQFSKLWPELSNEYESLAEQFPAECSGCHRLFLGDSVILDLHFGDATYRMANLDHRAGINAWYLDGFKPANNQNLWHKSLINELARLSNKGTTLATYSVAGEFRRSLKSTGFRCQKLNGFGPKRHMLSAIYEPDLTLNSNYAQEPWNKLPISNPPKSSQRIAILGAGLAGSSLAYSLNRRGLSTTVFDTARTIAAGASGVPQFALRPRLFQSDSALGEYFLQSYLFAIRQLTSLAKIADLDWNNTGVLQFDDALNRNSKFELGKIENLYPYAVVQCHKELKGHGFLAASNKSILEFPQGGWICPRKLCEFLLEDSSAEIKLDTRISKIHQTDKLWILSTDSKEKLEFDIVIFANSEGITEFEQTDSIPLEITAGQVSTFSAANSNMKIDKVVCGSRSLFPTTGEGKYSHLVAASYRNSSSLEQLAEDDEENHISVNSMLETSFQLHKESQKSQVALRTNTPDRIPLVGQIPNLHSVYKEYRELGFNAKKKFSNTIQADNYFRGLYISAAHGSNGLATCGFSAEIISSLICNEQLPVSDEILDALNPVRFAIRNLKKQEN